MKIYTGVGSRQTPPEVLSRFVRLAKHLAENDWILRSGGADGADSAFEAGEDCVSSCAQAEIYLPWKGFNGNSSLYFGVCPEAMKTAAHHHPAWDRCSDAAKKLHSRNVYQVLGRGLNEPSAFVVCWTPDGAQTAEECTRTTGGTAMAIRVADAVGVPIFNFQRADAIPRLKQFLLEFDRG